jgi:hypothetical protein
VETNNYAGGNKTIIMWAQKEGFISIICLLRQKRELGFGVE